MQVKLEETYDEQKEIWTDCPACAYKHLTAAYAAITNAGVVYSDRVNAWEIYLARAAILATEAAIGYKGNGALAAGCLAMAEILAPDRGLAEYARRKRLDLQNGGPLHLDLRMLSAEALATGHLIEAAREHLDIQDEVQRVRFCISLPDIRGALMALRDIIHRIESDYMLGQYVPVMEKETENE